MSLTFYEICDVLKELHRAKEASYNGHSVIDDLPEDVWRAQIAIKGQRLFRASTPQKQVDEAFDTAVYAILWLEKQSKAGVDLEPILGAGVAHVPMPPSLAQRMKNSYIANQFG
ncbi:MAG: hypothetical protein M0P69_09355 [Bacteroidales bacterium]|nr:hypothetical protein [Bacteroidales bacterium]